MEVGQHLKDEFMEQFIKLFPEKIKFIDLEINRFGNLLEYETILGRFILNHINFYKKDEVSIEDFENALNPFRTNYDIFIKYIYLNGKEFEIGDGDDLEAVTYRWVNGKYVATIWLRWWEETGG